MSLTHTVYFFFGSVDFVHDYVARSLNGVHPVFSSYDFFAIADAQALRKKLSEYANPNEIMVVRIEKIQQDSQNVLLKVCEDLTHNHIIFSFPHHVQLIDTLLSRGVVVRDENLSLHFGETAQTFFNESYAKRIKVFEKLIKDHDEREPKLIVTQLIEDLIQIQPKQHVALNGPLFVDALKLLVYQKSSPKNIIEYIALLLKK